MCLEKKLKVKAFRNEKQKALINIYYTQSQITGRFKNVLKPFDLTPQQFNVLRILKGQYPKHLKITDVKNRIIDSNSDLTRIIDRMEKKDLIHRIPCKVDRRQMNLYITEKGIKKLEEVNNKVEEFEDTITEMNEENLLKLNELLAELRN